MSPEIFLIAGEASGDRLGAGLMRGLRDETGGAVRFSGIGGPQMAAEGLESLIPMDALSVMGLAEVLPRLPGLLARIREAADAVIAARPAALVTIDSPDFGLRVAARARRALPGLRTIHYVAPSVWAWRPGRANKMARVIDHVLALLPFEPPYMTAAGMSCDFVGHPAAEIAPVTGPEREAFRAAHDIGPDAPLLALLPGSRAGEVARHGALLRAVAERLAVLRPGLRLVIPTVAARADAVAALFAGSPAAPVILDPRGLAAGAAERQKQVALAAADAALAVSGTVSVEIAAAGTPMAVAYRANPVTAFLARRLVRVKYASLVNILLDAPVIPEYLFGACTEDALTEATVALLDGAGGEQTAAFERAMEMLGRGGDAPGLRAARSVLAAIG